MKLYELADAYRECMDAIESGEVPEEAIADTLESINVMLEDKADNIACMIKNLTAEAEAIKAEETRLAERRKAKERQIDRIKTYLSDTLLNSGHTKIETARNKISFRSSESVVVDDDDEFIMWAEENYDALLTYPMPKIDKTAIKTALKRGEMVVGARIEKKQNIQIK